jgi:hypothetical protein
LGVDDDEFGFEPPRLRGDLVDLAATHQRRRNGPPQRHDHLGDHLEADGLGQADGFGQPRARIAIEVVRRFARFGLDVNDERRAPART